MARARARRASQATRDSIKGSGQHPVVKEEPEPQQKAPDKAAEKEPAKAPTQTAKKAT